MSSKTNRKEKEVNTAKPEPIKKKEVSPGSVIDKLIYLSALITVFASVYFINHLLTAPPMPEVDLNEYWGGYPMDVKPDLSIKPYKIEFSDAIIADLKERLLHRRPLPPPLENAGFSYGFNSNFLTQVLDFWANSYKFKDRERFLNKFNHFTTKVNGLNIHFIHAKPQLDENIVYPSVPILLMHGWPGSIREFYELIPLLTKPSSRNFVFEVIVPSMPGFGYSEAPTRQGFGPMEMAVVMRNLMDRLGFSQYYIQGGDLGHSVGSIMATLFPDKVLGFHTNFPVVLFNPMAYIYQIVGVLFPTLVEEKQLHGRMYPISDVVAKTVEESGYMHIQATRPDTVGAALSDSPAGLAAYILEKFAIWTDPNNKKAYDGNLLNKFTLTQLLDNVMIYWTTNTITTSIRIYAETMNKRQILFIFDRIPTEVPTWGVKFPNELVHHSDSMLKCKYKNYLQSSIVGEGGHFAALENPDLMAYDIYDAVHNFIQFHGRTDISKNKPPNYEPKVVYEFTVNDIHGRPTSLIMYEGMVLIIVNVASQCGFTDTNYKELNELHDKYYKRGLRILAFPCNQFNGQEPGTSSEILKFTRSRKIKFDMFEKVDVNGANASPLWVFLKRQQGGTLGDFIKWNFSKFIIDRNGVPVRRYGSNVTPKEMEADILLYLNKNYSEHNNEQDNFHEEL